MRVRRGTVNGGVRDGTDRRARKCSCVYIFSYAQ